MKQYYYEGNMNKVQNDDKEPREAVILSFTKMKISEPAI